MSLDDRTVAVYSALDSVTLLALLPALQYEAERAKDEADMFERARLVIPEQTVGAFRAQGETVITREPRRDEPGAPEGQLEIGPARERPASGSELGRVLESLDHYRA